MKLLSSSRAWFMAITIVTLTTLGLIFSPAAAATDGPPGSVMPPVDRLAIHIFDQQIFNENLTVEAGEVVDEDVTVFRGNVEIQADGSIVGDLSVFSGNVTIAGTLDGDLSVIGGNADLRNSARVTGDISIVGGQLQRSDRAFIGGDVVGGPRVEVEGRTERAERFEREVERAQSRPYLLGVFFRLIQAILWTLLIAGLVLLLRWLFPNQLKEIQSTGEEQPAMSFIVGLVASVAALLLGAVLAITICLLPFSLLIWALLAVVTLVGWAVLSIWLGERLEDTLRQQVGADLHPLIPVAIGALLLTGVTFLAWSLVECLGIFLAVLLGSTGTGAVLIHLIRRTNLTGGASGLVDQFNRSVGSSTSPSPGGSVVVTDPTAGNGGATAHESTGETDVEAQLDDETIEQATGIVEEAEDVEETLAVEGFVTGEELGLTDEERLQLRQGAGIDSPPDDFTRIHGIGPAFNQRLIEAGVTRFAQLATMTPEEISAIVGWPPERILRDQLREQAAELASR